jgi:twitching motility protein PilT
MLGLSAQLEQILGYLDKDGVSEIVMAIGRPVVMRQKGAYVNLTARPLTMAILTALLEGSPISPLIPWSDESPEPSEVDVGKRKLKVRTGRRGDEVVVRVELLGPASPPTKTGTRAKGATSAPRTRPASIAMPAPKPRTKGQSAQLGPPGFTQPLEVVRDLTSVVRTATHDALPIVSGKPLPARGKAASIAPRTKTPTRGARTTTSPRTKPASSPPRGKSATTSPRSKRASMPARSKPAMGKRTDDFELPMDFDLDELPSDALTAEPDALDLEADIAVVNAPKLAAIDARRSAAAPVSIGARPPSVAAATAAMLPSALPTPIAVRPQSAAFAKLVAAARAAKASDLQISAHRVASIRVNNELVPVEAGAQPLSREAVESMLLPLLGASEQVRLDAIGYVDLAVDAPGGGRLRANISRHQLGLKGTFRLALDRPYTLDELNVPKEVAKVVGHHQGFVVIAGPSGHGKTTTLAAFVDLVNSTKPYHILTVEDPIEIEHPRKQAVISQREAGRHTKNFASALKASLREDPDVIVIGELRDRETVEIALTAAETGHLVLATMSTPNAAKTLDRLIDMFPPDEHSQVRASIAGALRAIVAQRLLPKIGGGVVPAIELVTGVLPLAVLIRDDKLFQLPNLMQRGRTFGMIRFDDSLVELVRTGKITEETALAYAQDKKELGGRLRK